jgi:sulfonate dioxygenase
MPTPTPQQSPLDSILTQPQVTYEVQPPSYTSLKVLSGPPRGGGGDTLWSSQYAAYDMLSPAMQTYLGSLTALHSAEMQAQGSRNLGRPVRRAPLTTEHPLIRTNPVTGWKSLFFNPGFVTKIVGVPRTESDHVIRLLNEIVATSPEIHARFQWGEGDVAFWDNRVVNHSASYGFAPHRRHGVRVAVRAEKPYLDQESVSQEEYLSKTFGVKKTRKDGSGVMNYND